MHEHCEAYIANNKLPNGRKPKILTILKRKSTNNKGGRKRVAGAPKGPTPAYFLFYKD